MTPATRDCFFIIQGNGACDGAVLDEAMLKLGETLVRFCGGRYEEA